MSTITIKVARYQSSDSKPHYQTYTIPYHADWVVLDALNYIKDEIDGSLSFRWSCHMGVCGSCGMQVNGSPTLTCASFLREIYPKTVVIEPLPNFPVIRDLVTDISNFLDKFQSIKPYVVRQEPLKLEDGETKQSPAQLEEYRQLSQCINCMLCYAACPVYGHNEDFIGPAAMALAQRYNEDPRDQGNAERRKVTNSHEGTWQCTFVGQCSVVCPKHVDPAAAIQRMKLENATSWLQSFVLPRRK